MKVHELNTTRNKTIKRVGRGISAGQGKTAGRGTKGQNSRAGSKFKPGFEGGQTKLAQRLPKERGFKPLNRITYQVINLSDIESLAVNSVDAKVLNKVGLIRHLKGPTKLLGNGTIKLAVTISVDKASASATAAIQKAGGKVILTAKPKPEPKPNSKKPQQ